MSFSREDGSRRVFRATSAVVWLVLTAVVALVLLGDALLRAGIGETLLLAPWVLLVVWGVYVAIFVSCVQTDAAGIRLRNLLRIVDIPWSEVADIRLRWQLEVVVRDESVARAFGGPTSWRAGRASRRPATESAAVASEDLDLIREQWESATGGAGSVRRTWDVWSLAALAALIVWAIIAVLITG